MIVDYYCHLYKGREILKISRLSAFILSLIIIFSAVIFPETFTYKKTMAYAVSASDADGAVVAREKDFSYTLAPKSKPKYALVLKYTGTDSKIIIPDTLAGYPVQTLSTDVFSECKNLTYIKIPASVKSVSGKTFAECRKLKEIDIDSANTNYVVEDGVLYNFDKTTLVAYPCSKGGEFTVPESVISIGSFAFCGAYNLTKVTMYNSVRSIYESAFQGCFNLKEIRLSDTLSVLGKKALANCDELKELHLPASLYTIGEDALLGDMDSDNSKFYYLTKGIYCTNKSNAYKYVYNLGIRTPHLKKEERTLTDIKTGVKIIDTHGILPLNEAINIQITPVITEEVTAFIPIRYNHIQAYDITMTNEEGDIYTPSKNVVIWFDSLPAGSLVSSAKVYRVEDGKSYELLRSPHTPFVGAQTVKLGRFAIITNNDFTKKGDIDGDNIVTSYDARMALCIAADLVPDVSAEQKNTADIDKNAVISTDDARNILRIASGILV